MQSKFKYIAACFLLCFTLISKAQITTLEVFKYTNDPHLFEDTTGIIPIPDSKQEIEVYELATFMKDRNNLVFYDSLNSTSVVIDAGKFNAKEHTYNPEEYTIDDKVFFGCDCTPDSTYNHFTQLRMLAVAGNKNLLRFFKNLPLILNPILTNQQGEPTSKMFYLKKQKLYMLNMYGGDSAGAYELYIFFNKTEVKAIYHRNINTDNVQLSAYPKAKDLFSDDKQIYYYNFVFESS